MKNALLALTCGLLFVYGCQTEPEGMISEEECNNNMEETIDSLERVWESKLDSAIQATLETLTQENPAPTTSTKKTTPTTSKKTEETKKEESQERWQETEQQEESKERWEKSETEQESRDRWGNPK